jgi:hypothetical protein
MRIIVFGWLSLFGLSLSAFMAEELISLPKDAEDLKLSLAEIADILAGKKHEDLGFISDFHSSKNQRYGGIEGKQHAYMDSNKIYNKQDGFTKLANNHLKDVQKKNCFYPCVDPHAI